jgi:hypothetical protein
MAAAAWIIAAKLMPRWLFDSRDSPQAGVSQMQQLSTALHTTIALGLLGATVRTRHHPLAVRWYVRYRLDPMCELAAG